MLVARHTIFAMPDVGGTFPATQVTGPAVIKTVIVSLEIAPIAPVFADLGLGPSRITCGIQVRRRRKTIAHALATVISIVVSCRFQQNDGEANWRFARNPAPKRIAGVPNLCSFRCRGKESDSILLANLVPY